MATISKDRNVYRVRFTYNGKREEVRLPGQTKRQAQIIADCVERIIAAKKSGTSLDDLTAKWIGEIDEAIFSKLFNLGLVRHRTTAIRSETLAEFLERFHRKGRTNAGKKATENTLKKWRTTIDYLKECFGNTVGIENITIADAHDFRGWLEDRPNIKTENAIRKHCQTAQTFFNAAIDAEIIDRNPFRKLPTTSIENKAREYFVTRDEFDACIAKCPDLQWKVILYLARVGGMRCPSELIRARWDDVQWTKRRMIIHATKTEGHEGKELRMIPLWSELETVLREAWEASPKGEDRILTRYTDSSQNMRTLFTKIINRAELKPWPKLFQNMRASRETELIDSGVPAHVAAAWIGHSVKVQSKSYLQVSDHHFEQTLQNG